MDVDTQRLLEAVLNMTAAHRQHEEYYAVAPLEQAVALQRHARALLALADRWATVVPDSRAPFSPYDGADDLNADVATQLDGVLFMEGEGEPVEIVTLKRDLVAIADDSAAAGEWLHTAMTSAWAFVPQLFVIGDLADLLGERHRIIANDWQAASLTTLVGHILRRAVDLLDAVDLTPAALRADLVGARASVGLVTSSVEMVAHAADLLGDFARLVRDNERRWRVFRARVVEITARVDDERRISAR